MRWLSAALLATLIAASTRPDECPMLGAVVHARHPVHAMDRSELEAELSGRGVAFGNSESDDDLRVRIYVVRSQRLKRRTEIVLSAEAVQLELERHSNDHALSELSLDTVLSRTRTHDSPTPAVVGLTALGSALTLTRSSRTTLASSPTRWAPGCSPG